MGRPSSGETRQPDRVGEVGSQAPKVAVVTGAARGIGWAVADRLLGDDWHVVAADLPGEVDQASDRHSGPGLTWQEVDVTDEASTRRLLTAAARETGCVDALVNNAGLTDVHRDWVDVTQEQWEQVMAVNLGGAFRCCRLSYPWIKRSPAGRIVNIGSVTFATGQRRLVDYVSSKGGIVGLTRVLARELGRDGITVNTVSPGAIRTERELAMFPDQTAISAAALGAQSIQRRGEPEDVAAVVAFLLRTDAGFISGQEIRVDGGWMFS